MFTFTYIKHSPLLDCSITSSGQGPTTEATLKHIGRYNIYQVTTEYMITSKSTKSNGGRFYLTYCCMISLYSLFHRRSLDAFIVFSLAIFSHVFIIYIFINFIRHKPHWCLINTFLCKSFYITLHYQLSIVRSRSQRRIERHHCTCPCRNGKILSAQTYPTMVQ